MKKIIITLLIVTMLTSVCYADFTDVINDAYGAGSEAAFDDIAHVTWAHDAINYFAENGIIEQNFGKKLYPDKAITREEFVDLLISAFGLYDESADCEFIDAIGNKYYGSIATANKLGIVNGMTEKTFGVGNNILRRDLCTMANRMLKYKGIEFEADLTLSFVDAAEIPEYALESVSVLTQMGIINGDNLNCFNPASNTTRAEAYKIVYLLMLKNA